MKTKARPIRHEDKSLRPVNSRLKRENSLLRKENRIITKKYDNLENRYKKIEKENKALRLDKKHLKKELAAVKKKLVVAKKELSKLKSKEKNQEKKKPVFWKVKTKKKQDRPGAPKGHKGVSRPRPKPEDVNNWVTIRPDDCPVCDTDLSKSKRTKKGDTRYYWDIPPTQVIVTEETEILVWCPKCKKYVRPKSHKVLPYKRFGIDLTAFATFLRMIATPRPKMNALFNIICGLDITETAFRDMELTVADALKDNYKEIEEEIKKADAVGGDETSWPINGRNYWLWDFVTPTATLFIIHKSRGRTVPTGLLNDGNDGCLVDDGWNAYNKVKRPKQQCFVHINRQFQKIETSRGIEPRGFLEDEPPVFTRAGRPPREFLGLALEVRALMRKAVEFSKRKVGKKAREKAASEFEAELDELINRDYKDDDCKRKVKFLRQHRDEIFTFVRRPEVPWHNNAAEAELRGPVVTRKVSYGHKSEAGAKAFAIIASVYRTCIKRGINFVEFVRSALRGESPTLNVSKN